MKMVAVMAGLIGLWIGCATPSVPTIASFSAGAMTVTTGKSTTLTATFSGGTGTIDHEIGSVTSGVAVSTGKLTESTTFTLTVTNPSGESVKLTVLVTVVAAPMITSLVAAKTIVSAGRSTLLTAVFAGGTGTVDNSVGAVTTGLAKPTGVLTMTTTFTLTVTNAAGDSSVATTRVTVVEAPAIASFTAQKTTVTTGKPTILTAIFSGGVGAIDNNLGSVTTAVPVSTGPLSQAKTFTLTVSNEAGDSTTSTVTVNTVAAPLITLFTVEKTILTTGKATNLTATFSDGAGAIDNGIGPISSPATQTTGILTSSTVYILTVTNKAGDTVSAAAPVTVVPAPAITSFTPAKSPLTNGNSTTIAWNFSGGTGAINHGIGPVLSSGSASTGILTQSIIYTLTVTNPAGDIAVSTAPISVVPPPAITSFTAAPAYVAPGATTQLTALFTGGTGQVDNNVGAVASGVAKPSGAIVTNTPFTLTVTNSAGTSITATTPVAIAAHLFVANYSSGTVVRYRTTDSGTNVVPQATITSSSFSHPSSVVVSSNELFVADYNNSGIYVFANAATATGALSPVRTIKGGSTGIASPNAIAVYSGELFEADALTGMVRVFPASWNGTYTAAPTRIVTALGAINYMAVAGGVVYLACTAANVKTYPSSAGSAAGVDFNSVPSAKTLIGANTGLSVPMGIGVFGSELFVTDSGTTKLSVFKLTDSGNLPPIRLVSGANTKLGNIYFGLAASAWGIFVPDNGSSNVVGFDLAASGNVAPQTTLSGTIYLNAPNGLWVEPIP